ncbi:putative Exocyst complex component EXO84B [Cocos nucifera]|uniref:Putative Exocyst complex component EXO84B n=1 Tax=Cocos nucifera TaxID=13894 RepID=A0A8K0IC83_COCNU|nr:putative Exocyst complex component EXO84B [Cocos nucifera]
MASAKSTRSRASGPLGVATTTGLYQTANGAAGQESGVQLADKLKIFKTNNFDPDAYVQSKCQTMNEKEIRHLCSYLQDLKKASAEEMRRSVYANYAAFIRTSREISDLEGELLSIRNLLSTQAALIHGLAEGVHIDSLSAGSEGSAEDDVSNVEDREATDIEKWSAEFPNMLDVLLAERRVDEALDALDEAEHIAAEAKQNQTLSTAQLLSLQTAISDHRQKLADQLAEAACQSSTRGVELRAAASALKRLGDGPRAHSLLLNAHNQRLQYNLQTIHPTSTSYGGAYTAALSQQVFSAIAQAVSDSLEVFGDEPAYASELIAIGHCSLLEARGLSLSSVLLKLFRPSVEQALDANLKRIEESTAALAAADNWLLMYPPASARTSVRSSATTMGIQPKLSSSAHRFNSMVQVLGIRWCVVVTLVDVIGGFGVVGMVAGLWEHVPLNALASMTLVASGVTAKCGEGESSMEDEANLEGSGNKIVRIAETEAQQLALLANASLLAEELLPRAAMKLSSIYQAGGVDDSRRRTSDRHSRIPEQREWKRKLQRSVDRLRDSFCRQHALDLIFTEDGDTHLSAEMYISLDGNVEEPEWAPSPIFQELYAKLNRMASIAADMFVGRERFSTLLMMRLTETVVLWLSEDQSFWEDIEEGPRPLGPLGLQQFVILFGQGRFLSRHVHQVIIDIIERAMAAFSATGMNPDRYIENGHLFNRYQQNTNLKVLINHHQIEDLVLDLHEMSQAGERLISALSLARYRQIKKINLEFARDVEDEHLILLRSKGIESLQGLESLNLNGCQKISDKGIEAITSVCPNLRAFSIYWNVRITDLSIKHLANNCKRIIDLNLSGSERKEWFIFVVHVTFICHHEQNISDQSLHLIAESYQGLEELNITSCGRSVLGKKKKSGSTMQVELKVHQINRWWITADTSKMFFAPKFESICPFKLPDCQNLSDQGLSCIARCKDLVSLNLTWCVRVTDLGVVAIAQGCRSLEFLSLFGIVGVTDTSLQALSEFCSNTLTTLDVNGCIGIKFIVI